MFYILLAFSLYRKYISSNELAFERCRHVLQSLSGSMVDIRVCREVDWYDLQKYRDGEYVVTCQRKVNTIVAGIIMA